MYDLHRRVPCESWRPELSENVVVFEVSRFQAIVIGCQSWVKFREKFCWEGGVTKKRHGHNFDFWGLKRIAWPSHMVGMTCYLFRTSKIIIVAVSFFCEASLTAKFFSEFDPTLTDNNYGLKPSNFKNYPIFRILRMSDFTWYHPT